MDIDSKKQDYFNIFENSSSAELNQLAPSPPTRVDESMKSPAWMDIDSRPHNQLNNISNSMCVVSGENDWVHSQEEERPSAVHESEQPQNLSESQELTDILADLMRNNDQKPVHGLKEEEKRRTVKEPSIRDFFPTVRKKDEEDRVNLDTLYQGIESDFRHKAKNSCRMNEKIKNVVSAGLYWRKRNITTSKKEKTDSDNIATIPSLQDLDSPPIMLGGDVKTLYPSLDSVTTSEIAAQAIRDTKIKFGGIDYPRLSVYLTLSLGESLLTKKGLGHITARRTGDSKALSLSAKSNKDLTGWKTDTIFSDSDKREMMALLVQINTIILMSYHVYTFGGKLYCQKEGAGIGLRASACLARIVMCHWDSNWAQTQTLQGLTAILFIRYVDDLRLYINAIKKGWSWVDGRWHFSESMAEEDKRTPETRTREEINKSFDDVVDCLFFTTETQGDFAENTLPTLDVQTSILESGEINFKHYTKPMASNLLLERTTALSKETVFNSLRQDLVRRLLHTRRESDWSDRMEIIENFTQLLANSGHRYDFCKSIILQALTKYEDMYYRSTLDETNKLFLPLYRDRIFDRDRRQITKYISPLVWYTGSNVKDPYRNNWKGKLKYKENRNLNARLKLKNKSLGTGRDGPRVSTTMFVPSSRNGLLKALIQRKEEKLLEDSQWTVKILERSGTPLVNSLSTKMPIVAGCPTPKKM